MIKKKKQTILIVALILSLVLIISGVTYAFFNYARQGTTDNTITTGSITFLYTENSGTGRGVSIVDAYPISDTLGKTQTGSDKMFDFKITSNTMNKSAIEYEITARKSKDSTLAEDVVKVYLTKVDGTTEEEIILSKYNSLTQTTKVSSDDYTEKTLYTKKIPSNTANYEESYRLRMWIDEKTDFSGVEQEDGTITYPYNDKIFKLTVNVYANGKVITEEEVAYEANANISTLSVEGEELTAVEDEEYDYTMNLPEGTTETTINVETENPNATVEVEKIDSLAYSNNIKRLSTSKTLNLTEGNNYFKVKITSENKQENKEYIIKIKVGKENINTLNSLSLTNCTLSPAFNSETTNYTCTVSNSITSVTPTYEKTSDVSTVEVSGNTNLQVGSNTVTITVKAESGAEKVYTIAVTRDVNRMSSSTSLSVGQAVTATDGSKWHVLEASASGTDTVVLLSDYNLNSDGTYNTTCGYDINGTTSCGGMKFDSDNTNIYDDSDSNNIGYFIKNTYAPKVTMSLPGTTNVTLSTAYQIASAAGKNFNNEDLALFSHSWLTTTDYWTKTSSNNDQVFVLAGGVYSINAYPPSGNWGARPVITTPKTNLLAQ